MKKLMALMAVVIFTATSLQAQTSKAMFSIGLEPSLPIGKFGDFYSFGIGGSLQGEIKVDKELGLTLNAGYINYSGKSNVPSIGIIPVLAGAKYYASPKVYIHGQLGAGFGTEKESTTSFVYTPGIGFILSKNFDVLLKYVGYSADKTTSSSIGARLAYNF